MTQTTAKWAERVQGWRSSGKTAEDYASEFDFAATTLRYWASRLKSEAKPQSVDVAPKTAANLAIARVVRRAPAVVAKEVMLESPTIEVIVGSVRVAVRRDFDPDTLRKVVMMLGGMR